MSVSSISGIRTRILRVSRTETDFKTIRTEHSYLFQFLFLYPIFSSSFFFFHFYPLFATCSLSLSYCICLFVLLLSTLSPPAFTAPLFHSHLSTSLLSSFLPSFPPSVITEILSSQKIVENHDDARGRFRNAKEIRGKTKMAGRMSG